MAGIDVGRRLCGTDPCCLTNSPSHESFLHFIIRNILCVWSVKSWPPGWTLGGTATKNFPLIHTCTKIVSGFKTQFQVRLVLIFWREEDTFLQADGIWLLNPIPSPREDHLSDNYTWLFLCALPYVCFKVMTLGETREKLSLYFLHKRKLGKCFM